MRGGLKMPYGQLTNNKLDIPSCNSWYLKKKNYVNCPIKLVSNFINTNFKLFKHPLKYCY